MAKNKRFELDSEVGFIDTQKCGGDTMTPFEVVVKLNKLNEENEQLKSEINMLKITIARNESYIEKITHKGEWHC